MDSIIASVLRFLTCHHYSQTTVHLQLIRRIKCPVLSCPAKSMEISTESDNNEIGQDDNEDVFEMVEVIAEYESETNMHEGEELDITDILDIEVPVVAIEHNSISLTLGDESFSLPKSQKVRMTAARQMAINDSPDK